MEITQVPIQDLKPAEYNPRQWDKKSVDDLTASIKEFGLVDPIIVNGAENRKNIVIGGHFRLKIAKDMGFTEIPVVYVSLPDENAEKKLNLRLNRNQGAWDWDLLANFDEEMLKEVGFDSWEIDKLKGIQEDDFDAAGAYDSIQEPVAKRGDIYELGRHRIMCGDSIIEEDFGKLMNGKLANLIFTDPPYAVDYHSPAGMTYASKKYGGTGGKIFNDDKTIEEAYVFFKKALEVLNKFTTEDVAMYWWFANKNNHINRKAWEDSNWYMSQIIIWVKNSMIFSRGQDYHRQYEPCMFGWKKGKKHFTNKKIASYKDVFTLEFDNFKEAMESFVDIWYQQRDATTKYKHPTQKPIKLTERALKKNSFENAIVLDAFLGSGSTLMACEQMNRICYGMELDPKFVDVIVERWEQFTGQKANKIV